MRERTRLDRGVNGYRRIERELEDALGLIELAEAEGDQAMLAEARERRSPRCATRSKQRELESLLSGEADANDAYLEVHAGAGGTEAQDWAEMLLRMYTRWAEQHGYKVEWLEESPGEERRHQIGDACGSSARTPMAGSRPRAACIAWCASRPSIANARRHTSFASVWVYPVVDDKIEVEVQDKYLRVDTYRSSGAGGQHVNKTDSAVRITYTLPDAAIVVARARASARSIRTAPRPWPMLKARLYELELQKREAAVDAMNATKTDIGWGHQIRSYVLQPYQMVKDLRTGVETGNTGAVLDGDLDRFLASLARRRASPAPTR